MNKDLFCHFTIDNFDNIKNKILNEIDALPKLSYDNKGGCAVYKTDWYLQDTDKPYINIVFDIIQDNIPNIQNWIGHKVEIELTNIWFQQYKKNHYHSFHTHPRTNLSGIFYIELPYPEHATIFSMGNNKVNAEVAEGDILLFPGYFPHKSPKNLYEERKTIVSFNLDIILSEKNYVD